MINLLEDVHSALAVRAFYLALMGALALPDICASVEHADGRAKGDRYIAWFDKWLRHKYSVFLTGEDCYHFRCAMLHQGMTGDPARKYRKVCFVLPGASTGASHCNILGDVLNLDLPIFCGDLTSAVWAWLLSVEGTEPFETNIQRIVRVHPEGLAGYYGGQPVIA
jgi:hypothetical protein